MVLKTTRFGDIEIDPESVITFTQPIIGFLEYRRFVLLPGPPESKLTWLQSAEAPELAFLLMDPRQVVPDYKVKLTQHDLSELAATDVADLEIGTLLVVPADRSKVRTNLKAPILINIKRRLAKQVVLDGSDYPIQFFLAQADGGERKAQKEVSHARSDA